jgi:DNA-binding NtrC family response regulator
MKILIVDDNDAFAENMAEILAMVGHQVEVAPSAEVALAYLQDPTRAELLLTDYRLPGANGADLIRAARSVGNSIPALVITAHGDEVAPNALEAGAAGVLRKPVALEQLMEWLASVQKAAPPSHSAP